MSLFLITEVEGEVRLVDSKGNEVIHTSTGEIRTESKPKDGETWPVKVLNELVIRDDDEPTNRLKINSRGQASVVIAPPEAPVNKKRVTHIEYSSISKNEDSVYTIPKGKNLTLQVFSGGSTSNRGGNDKKGSRIELYYDPKGDGSDLTLIDVLFTRFASDSKPLTDSFTGDGTCALRMRRIPDGGGARWILGKWVGYY